MHQAIIRWRVVWWLLDAWNSELQHNMLVGSSSSSMILLALAVWPLNTLQEVRSYVHSMDFWILICLCTSYQSLSPFTLASIALSLFLCCSCSIAPHVIMEYCHVGRNVSIQENTIMCRTHCPVSLQLWSGTLHSLSMKWQCFGSYLICMPCCINFSWDFHELPAYDRCSARFRQT